MRPPVSMRSLAQAAQPQVAFPIAKTLLDLAWHVKREFRLLSPSVSRASGRHQTPRPKPARSA